MPCLRPYTGSAKLVLAFDIGTTCSGVSYCILERGRVPEVHAVKRFPTQRAPRSDAKVPSLLYYDRNNVVRAAGAEALVDDVIKTAQDEGWTKAEWWKLHLRPKDSTLPVNAEDDLPPLPSGKSAVDVLADFLRYLFDSSRTYIQECHSALTWSSMAHTIEYILTYPSGWGEQEDLYLSAIERAGLVPDVPEERHNVYVLTEGEACLQFCISQYLRGDAAEQAFQGVAIIDAGGGTIDLSMFSMAYNPISCEEIAPAECRLQGSTFVTRRAGVLLQRKLEGWEHAGPDDIVRFTHEFDETTKLIIESNRDPAYVKVAGRRISDPKYCISSGRLKLSGEEATSLFDESIDAIIHAFEHQITLATTPITTAFFVGGLSTNDWVWSRLQSYFTGKNINVRRPNTHINRAVADGAVLSHVDRENRVVAPKPARLGRDYLLRPNVEERGLNVTVEPPRVQNNRNTQKSIDIRSSTMDYITEALSQVQRGELKKAIQIFDLAFWNCNPHESNLLLLIKTIIFFMAKEYEEAFSRALSLIAMPSDDQTLYCCHQVLAKMYLMRGDAEHALHSLQRAQNCTPPNDGCLLENISLICGWNFNGLQITAQLYHCKALLVAGRAEEAAEALGEMLETFGEEISANKETATCVMAFKNESINALETLGDAALSLQDYAKAISQYSVALSLNPSDPIDILVKRSKTRTLTEMWEEALADANEVVKLDPSSHRGYEMQYVALHGAGHYDKAIDAIQRMLARIESSLDEDICKLRGGYTNPREIIPIIDSCIHEVFKLCPLVLIDVLTGKLCDAATRTRLFKSEKPFKRLVSETAATRIDRERVLHAVAEYFKWVMLSHTWEGNEPTFQDVNLVVTVWSLDKSPLNEKLRQFCMMVRGDGYRWAWSDTCCIDKRTSAILSQSLTSMYHWYEEAAVTLVYLVDVLSSSRPGALTKSRWMTRAWTLQELLASKVIRFYHKGWKLYLGDMHPNHKESPVIQQELAYAMEIPPKIIVKFRPSDLGVRAKLRLAATRNATVEEDVAYSLIGIFSSDIMPRYGLRKTALGQLLENIVARSGDVTVIAWTGKPSSYNSALPTSLAVYNQKPHSHQLMAVSELVIRVEKLRTLCSSNDAKQVYDQVIRLPRASFSNRCLHLPCIMFPVRKINVLEMDKSHGHLYSAKALLLGRIEFRTTDVMPLRDPEFKLVFVHPWLHDLRDPRHRFVSDVESEIRVGFSARSSNELDEDSDSGSSSSSRSSHAEPPAAVDRYILALRFIARLGLPFNALLLEQQQDGRYKRVAAEHEIITSGIPYPITPMELNGIRANVLEII